MDSDEKHDSILEKLRRDWVGQESDDPVGPVTALLARQYPEAVHWRVSPSVDVPGWLRPFPPQSDRSAITAEAVVDFIDQDGCRRWAAMVEEKVRADILPFFPCMIAVDHSLTGGAYRAVADHYGRENVSLIVVDSHTDAIPMSRLAGAIQYDLDTNPASPYDRSDPLLYNRSDSYNASSFLFHMLADGDLAPRDLYLFGISDFPEKRALRIKDPRITNYVSAYTELQRRGVTVATKKECQQKPGKIKNLLNRIRTPCAYLSIDLDIGARNAVEGVRFKNWRGLQEKQIYRLVESVADAGGADVELVGMDITEINPRQAGRRAGDAVDRTYPVAARVIDTVVFGRTPENRGTAF